MQNKYVCSICGKTHYDLGEYVSCVTRCGEALKKHEEKEKERKRLEELNAALNRVKQAKSYFEQQLNEFKEKYPKEYELNFVEDKEDSGVPCDGKTCADCETNKKYNPTEQTESIAITYKNDGKNKPELCASINGKKVSDDALNKLFEDPDAKFLAKLIEIL